MSERGELSNPEVISRGARGHSPGDKPVDTVDKEGQPILRGVAVDRQQGPSDTNGRASRSGDATEVSGPSRGATPTESGRDLAHAALRAAREKAAARGAAPGAQSWRPGAGGGGSVRRMRRRWSSAGPDERDPQPLGRMVSRLAKQRGWNNRLANGQVFGEWARLVGEEVAEHAQPVALKDGELTVRASSTAWATQLRMLQSQLIAKITAGVGKGVVKKIRIQGPTKPSWRYGPRHVSGRGPRDTYG